MYDCYETTFLLDTNHYYNSNFIWQWKLTIQLRLVRKPPNVRIRTKDTISINRSILQKSERQFITVSIWQEKTRVNEILKNSQ